MVSSIGSRMTVFAITIWAWNSPTRQPYFGEFFFLRSVAIALYSSNRSNRKHLIMLGDMVAERHCCPCCYILAAMCNSGIFT